MVEKAMFPRIFFIALASVPVFFADVATGSPYGGPVFVESGRVWNSESKSRILESFSLRDFVPRGRCLVEDLDADIATSKDFHFGIIKIDSQVEPDSIHSAFLPEHLNWLHNHFYDGLRADSNEKRGVIGISLHEISKRYLEDYRGLEIKPHYLDKIRRGDFFGFGQECSAYFVSGLELYSGAWVGLVFNETNARSDEIFVRDLERYLFLVHEGDDHPPMYERLEKKLASREVALYYTLMGAPLMEESENLQQPMNSVVSVSDLAKLRNFFQELRKKMAAGGHQGRLMALELSPWSNVNGFEETLWDYIDSSDPSLFRDVHSSRRWSHFQQNLEAAGMHGVRLGKLNMNVSRVGSCRSDIVSNHPLKEETKDTKFKNHQGGMEGTLETLHLLIDDKMVARAKNDVDVFIDNYITSCAAEMNGKFFSESYHGMSDCSGIDSYMMPSYPAVESYCPPIKNE